MVGLRRSAAPVVIILVSAIAITIAILRSSPPTESTIEPAAGAGYRAEQAESSPSDLEKILSATIGPRRLLQSMGKDAAVNATKGLHKGNVKPAADATIGSYEGGITIWLTRYESDRMAKEQLEKMKQAMERYGGGFERLSEEKLGGSEVFVTRPKGEIQYFWSRKDVVAYLIPGNLGIDEIQRLIKDLNEKVDGLRPLAISNGNSSE